MPEHTMYPRGRGIQSVDFHITPESRPYNPTINFTRDVADQIATIAKVQDGVTHTKTVTRNACGRITSISPWVQTP